MLLSKSRKRRFVEAVHYVSSSLLSKNPSFLAESPKKMLTLLAIPFGIILWLLVLYKTRKSVASTEL
jgi:hypothetical protein